MDLMYLVANVFFVYIPAVLLASSPYDIQLECTYTTKSVVTFSWLVFGAPPETTLHNCSVSFTPSNTDEGVRVVALRDIGVSGTYTQQGLRTSGDYGVKLRCNKGTSSLAICKMEDIDRSPNTNISAVTTDSPVVKFKDTSWHLGSRDSVLGIVIGLCGLIIILVASFYLLKKYRHRRRLQRIRQYLGSSLIDPFDNLRNRNQDVDNGAQMLIGSADSLT